MKKKRMVEVIDIMSKKLICRIIGHKHSPFDTDSGYVYCKRCNAHEYYDVSEYHKMTLIDTPKYVWWWITKFYYKYKYRSKPDDTLPF